VKVLWFVLISTNVRRKIHVKIAMQIARTYQEATNVHAQLAMRVANVKTSTSARIQMHAVNLPFARTPTDLSSVLVEKVTREMVRPALLVTHQKTLVIVDQMESAFQRP